MKTLSKQGAIPYCLPGNCPVLSMAYQERITEIETYFRFMELSKQNGEAAAGRHDWIGSELLLHHYSTDLLTEAEQGSGYKNRQSNIAACMQLDLCDRVAQ